MPSSPIPLSNSAPGRHSLSHSDVHKSVHSAGSLAAWPKKLGDFIKIKGSPTSKNAGLTEENLQELNRRNAILETRYSTSSPYYKGLTDFSLVINREKLSGSSPGRESHAATFVSSASKSSFVVQVRKWSTSCYSMKNHEKTSSSSSSFWSKSSRHNRAMTSDSSSLKATAKGVIITKIRTKTTNDSESEREEVSFTANGNAVATGLSNKKPLSEREQEIPPNVPSPTSQPQISSQTTQDLLLPPSPPPAKTSPMEEVQTPATADAPPQISSKNTEDLLLPPSPPPLAQTPPIAAAQTSETGEVILKNEETKRSENDRKYVWAGNYRPFYLQDFLCNRRTALWLQDVGEGVGSVLVNLMVSQQHTEVKFSELKGYEKHILVELIKERRTKLSNKDLQRNHGECRAIILYDADKISTDILTYIKWTLERFKGCNKVFFCCSDVSRLEPVKSLCTVVQLLPPSIEEIVEVLKFIAKKEEIHLPHQLAVKFANSSNNNLRQAIRSFEATWHFNSSLTEDQAIKTGWEEKIANLARNIIQEQTPKQLYIIRGELQILIEHAVAPEFILKTLVEELKNHDESLQPLFCNMCDEYSRNHEAKKLMASACARDQQAELSKRETDSRKNVEQFMMIEGKMRIHDTNNRTEKNFIFMF
ncbi:unnamed protein product [Fraxinus pennsylvanica]|uniref:Replication factor C subunit 3 n=1 Tax=Fraxinus pennsylvanica TaxID=56036 RepID=A0AAD2A4T9_9LAMI|nr:unnamed protein product [Fraxinus pennsylvanica]